LFLLEAAQLGRSNAAIGLGWISWQKIGGLFPHSGGEADEHVQCYLLSPPLDIRD